MKNLKYKKIKNFLSADELNLLTTYCKMRHRTNFKNFEETGPNANCDSSFYADCLMESTMINKLRFMEKETGLELLPTYSYWRLYKNGDVLKRHKDRPSCEVSTTLCLGYNNDNLKGKKKHWQLYNWPMWVDKTGGFGNKGVPIHMEPGDMIVYRGCEIEHWREPFIGQNHAQVFLHYNNVDGPYGKNCVFDGRHHLGLPADFKDPKKIQAMNKADAELSKKRRNK